MTKVDDKLSTKELINSYLQEKRNKPVASSEVFSLLQNVIRREGLDVPSQPVFAGDPSISSDPSDFGFVRVHFYLQELPIGMSYIKGVLDLDEFERKYLLPLGYNVVERSIQKGGPDRTIGLETKGDYVTLRIKSFSKAFVGDKPRYLYHAAPSELESTILRKGLKPKSRTKNVNIRFIEQRLYLFYDSKKSSIESVMKAVFTNEREIAAIDRIKYTVFEIDTKKFDRFNLYHDQLLSGHAVYTLSHIPASALKVVHRRELRI